MSFSLGKTQLTSSLALGALILGLSGPSWGSLIFDQNQATNGTGFGTQQNILTIQKSGGTGTASDTETGKVAWDGTTSSDVLSGGEVISGTDKTATFTFGELGITDASQILLIWNPSETGSTAGDDTQVDRLILSVYAPLANQSVVFSDSLAAPVHHDSLTNPGIGGDDFSYVLDAAGIASLNSVLSGIGDFSSYRIGLESTVSYVDDGPDTWVIGSRPATVPEPGMLGLLAVSLAALSLARRRAKH